MSEETPVPLAAQIEKVQRQVRYAQDDHAERGERLWSAVLDSLQQLERLTADRADANERIRQHERAMAALNSPEIEDFAVGVRREAAHQVQRWGESHDRSKSSENWYWLVGYLAGKALRSSIEGDRDKALHHTISAAAALSHWHAAIKAGDQNGAGQDCDLAALDDAASAAATPAGKGE